MNEVNVEGLNAVEAALREPRITEPKSFERRDTVSLDIPETAGDRAARQVKEARLARELAAHSPIDDMLKARGSVHGDFTDHAHITQELKSAMQDSKNWMALTDVQTEALEMIQHKIGRILAGDPNHADHWADIQGYARLVEKSL